MVTQIWHWNFRHYPVQDTWNRSINVYHLAGQLEICVDLVAGVARESIELLVEPRRLTLRSVRRIPEPEQNENKPMRIVSMELDHGPYYRTIQLPGSVDTTRVKSHYTVGLLWIRLPLRKN